MTDTLLGKIHQQFFGWVEDAQRFVFISGLVVGLVYGRQYLRTPSVAAMFGPIMARV
ncbi:MAG: OpgC domain-containing protein [Rhodobacteraceae bacterium]|nr:OpgC domain-containing protein [Paracoccaceae bacterium]